MAEHIWRDQRYNRQIAVPLFGEHGQTLLSNASISVIGAGGVKSSLLLHLAAAGVGYIRIIDHDRVELSNLSRQVLYDTRDIGKFKALAASERLIALNPDLHIEAVVDRANTANYDELLLKFDLVIEGGDSHQSRLEFNRWACQNNKTYVHASAHYNYGYVLTVLPKKTACYECCYGDMEPTFGGPVPVMCSATAVSGSVALAEVINILLGRPPTLAGRVWTHQGWTNTTLTYAVDRRKACSACGSNI